MNLRAPGGPLFYQWARFLNRTDGYVGTLEMPPHGHNCASPSETTGSKRNGSPAGWGRQRWKFISGVTVNYALSYPTPEDRQPLPGFFFLSFFFLSFGATFLCASASYPVSIQVGRGLGQWGRLLAFSFHVSSPISIPQVSFPLSLSHFGVSIWFSCFAGTRTDFILQEMREYSWARSSGGVNHYCSQWFYLSSLQVSLLPTKVPSSW